MCQNIHSEYLLNFTWCKSPTSMPLLDKVPLLVKLETFGYPSLITNFKCWYRTQPMEEEKKKKNLVLNASCNFIWFCDIVHNKYKSWFLHVHMYFVDRVHVLIQMSQNK